MLLSDRIGTKYTAALPAAAPLKSRGPLLSVGGKKIFCFPETSQILLLSLPTSITVKGQPSQVYF